MIRGDGRRPARRSRAPIRARSAVLTLVLAAVALVQGPTIQAPAATARVSVAPALPVANAAAVAFHRSASQLAVMSGETATIAPAPRVIFSVSTPQPVVALTFDLDMSPPMLADLRAGVITSWIDRQALAELRQAHIRATLFMTGMWAEAYPALARELAQSGEFEVGNHSYSHPAFRTPCYGLGGRPGAALAWEVDHAQQVIQAITGVTPAYFRFPGGCLDPNVVGMVHRRALTPIQWSLNSLDAFNRDSAGVSRTVIGRVHAGDIVLMHLQGGPNAPSTAAALRTIIPALEASGYRFVTVSELLRLGPALEPPGFRGTVEAPVPAQLPAPRPAPAPAGVRPPSGPPYWVWTPWGWQKLSHPPTCRWQLNAKKLWVCV
ncbi:MAG TPA: polysaccharide deacetylase family protein [Candidatus Limnocylindrales bacterium]|nr:polysaccharide deacetylase family protein [Candidatus Limnocylindrales bacterium]